MFHIFMIILYLNIQLFKIIDYVFFSTFADFMDISAKSAFPGAFFEKIVEICENTWQCFFLFTFEAVKYVTWIFTC